MALPARQRTGRLLILYARTAGDPSLALAPIASAVRGVDANVPVRTRTMRAGMAESLATLRVVQVVLTVSAAIVLLLTAGGLYGLVSYTAAQSIKEVGVRIALGATSTAVFGVLVGRVFRLSTIGIVVGAAIAVAGTRLIGALVYGLSPHDPATFAGIAVALLAVTLVAGYLAVRQGVTGDPVAALRAE